jgi:hypothetical protein
MLNSLRDILLRFAMRRLLIFLLLLPLPLICQVKILMPVVVKDASGKPVTDLKISDFQVSGPKNISIDRMWLVPPQTVSAQDSRTPVVVIYDAAYATSVYPDETTKMFRWFLGIVAKERLPVSFYVNTADGLQAIYDTATPPEVLSAALALPEHPKTASADPQVESQAKKLMLLKATYRTDRFPFLPLNQIKSLTALARTLQASDKRKAALWIGDSTYYWSFVPFVEATAAWTMSELATEELNAVHISVYTRLYPSRYHSTGLIADWFDSQRRLTECTGGLSLMESSILDALQTVQADFGPYYMLAIAVPTPKENDWVPVKIKVNRPGLTVRAAPGFYGLKPVKAQEGRAAQP